MDDIIEYSFIVDNKEVIFRAVSMGVCLPQNVSSKKMENFLKKIRTNVQSEIGFYSNTLTKNIFIQTGISRDFLKSFKQIKEQELSDSIFKVFFESNYLNRAKFDISGTNSFLVKVQREEHQSKLNDHSINLIKIKKVIPKVYCLQFNNEIDASDNFKIFDTLRKTDDWVKHVEVNFDYKEYDANLSMLKDFSIDEIMLAPDLFQPYSATEIQESESTLRQKKLLKNLDHPKYDGYVNGKMLNLINAPVQQHKSPVKNNLIIGIADTTIDYKHKALSKINRKNKAKSFVHYDFQPEYKNIQPHGMQSLGLITGYEKNAINGKTFHSPGAGFAVRNAVMLEHFNDGSTRISLISILKSLHWLSYREMVDVISCSWRLYFRSEIVADLIKEITTIGIDGKKIPIVFSAGNRVDSQEIVFPACMKEVITVGGTDLDGNYAVKGHIPNWYSNEGKYVDLAAPGSFMISTDFKGQDGPNLSFDSWISNDYCFHFGTSAAAPLVSACIGLMLLRDSSLDPDQIKNILKICATKPEGWDISNWGSGILNIEATLANLNNN